MWLDLPFTIHCYVCACKFSYAHFYRYNFSYLMICLQMQATIKEEPLEEENEEEETRDDFAPQQRSRWLIGHLFDFSPICL